MKKTLILTAAAGMLFAATPAFAQGIIVKKDGTEIKTATIEISEKGDYRYTEYGDKTKTGKSIKKSDVKWAWRPMPKKIRQLDKSGNGSAAEYLKLAEEFKSVGWEPYCLLQAARAEFAAGNKKEAAAILEKLQGYKRTNPKNEEYVMAAYELLVKTYIEQGEFDKAVPVAESLIGSPNDNVACSALLAKGDALKAKAAASGDKETLKRAALAYFEAALLFPKSEKNAAALLAAYNCMQDAKDARAQKFAELLKKNHPGSPEAAALK